MRIDKFNALFDVRETISTLAWEEFMDLLCDNMVDSFAVTMSLEEKLDRTFVDGYELRSWLENEEKRGMIALSIEEEVFFSLLDGVADEIEYRLENAEVKDELSTTYADESSVQDYETLLDFFLNYLDDESVPG